MIFATRLFVGNAPGLRAWARFGLIGLFGYVLVLSVYASALFSLQALTPLSDWAAAGVAAAATGLGVLLLISLRNSIETAAVAAGAAAGRVPGLWWLAGCTAAGLALRLGLAAALDPGQSSDQAIYLDLAIRLTEGRSYFAADTWAFWPPGLPLALSAVLAALPDPSAAIQSLNAVLFCFTMAAAWLLARRLAGGRAARMTVLLLAVWPNYVLVFGLAHKEQITLLLLTAAVLGYLSARAATDRRVGALRLLLVGLALGYAELTQPSFLFFPLVLLAFELVAGRSPALGASKTAVVLVGMALLVVPWGLRNQSVLGEFTIGTAGGFNLYNANNPVTEGGWVDPDRLEVDYFAEFGEMEGGHRARAAALEWMTENPGAFAALVFRKHLLFVGSDAIGAYSAVRGGGDRPITPLYIAAKAVSNAFWLGLVGLLAVFMITNARSIGREENPALLFVLAVFYFVSVHSFFESDGRHHFHLIALLAVMAGAVFSPRGLQPAHGADRAGPGRNWVPLTGR